jgi:monovalent cation/hydrogen antiporter
VLQSTAYVICFVLLVVTVLAWVSSRLRVPFPILMTLGGLLIAVVPGLPHVPLDPGIFFYVILPPLLYQAGLTTSWRDFRQNIRPILLLAIGLVLVTMCFVAMGAHVLLGLGIASAFALGAIIGPTDTIAAIATTSRMRVPRRITTILEGESLVNDATALVALSFAIAAAKTNSFSLMHASWEFFYVAVGGIVIGYFVGMVAMWIRPRIGDDSVEVLVSLTVPYVAYIPADRMGVSGVLAAVVAGLYIGRQLPRVLAPEQRLRLVAIWDALVYLLNGAVFVLIGLQLPTIVENLVNYSWTRLILSIVSIAMIAVVLRVVWVLLLANATRWALPSVRRRDPPPPAASLLLIGYCGMRGIVSLAAALSLSMDFPGRDVIVVVTFGVVLFTLVGQGLSLPLLIRKLKLNPDDEQDRELCLARRELAHGALARLEAMEHIDGVAPSVLQVVRENYLQRIASYNRQIDEPDTSAPQPALSVRQIELAALEAERLLLIKLRDDGHISDEVLRQLQRDLDFAQIRLG